MLNPYIPDGVITKVDCMEEALEAPMDDTMLSDMTVDDIYYEADDIATSYLVRERLYPKIQAVLKTPVGDRKFKSLVGNFVDRNSHKLHTPGPMYMIPFGDVDKKNFMDCFQLDEKEVLDLIKDVIEVLRRSGSANSDFKLLRQNPIYWVFYCCIRYYSIETKDERGVNTALIIYALSEYPSIFHKYFKYEVTDPGAMQYTVDNLTEKFILKKSGHVFGMLTTSIKSSYAFLQPFMKDGSDKEVIRFIQRIRNDQNSLMKKICDNYRKNHDAGLSVKTVKDQFADVPVFDGNENNTSIINILKSRIVLPLLTNSVDIKRAEICAKLAQISIADTRFYLTKILVDKNQESIAEFIESVLFLFLYTDQKEVNDINSSYFLVWASQLFRKTNSNDANIGRIKRNLDEWAESSGVHAKFKREASRVNYKKAIFYYFILAIQAYTNG